MEEWKDVKDYTGYRISKWGRIWSNKLKRVILPQIDRYGYERIGLWKKQECTKMFIHRLVALHFIPNPEDKPTVNHKDGDKLNNHIDNLEWNTVAEQNLHRNTVLGYNGTKGINTKPVTLIKDEVEYHFPQTRDLYRFLKLSGKSYKKLRDGLEIKGYKII